MVYKLGSFTYNAETGLLTKEGKPIKVPAKTLEVLSVLAHNPGRLVSREELMSKVWAGAFVEEANLSVHISSLRRLFAQDGEGGVKIETFPKRGYRLTLETEFENDAEGRPPEFPSEKPTSARVRPAERPNLKITAGVAVLIVLSAVGGYFFVRGSRFTRGRELQVERVPGTERIPYFEISPGGEYIAQNILRDGKRNLQLTHLPTKSSIQLVEPTESVYLTITFTPDGGQIYFVRSTKNRPNTLYRVRLLGGDVEKVLENVDGRISFSPDGSRFAFFRRLPNGDTSLITADANGGDEKVLSVQTHPDHFTRVAVAWHPDGKRITAGLFLRRERHAQQLVNVDVETGAIEPFMPEEKWAGWESFRWLPDGTALVTSIRKEESVHNQLYILPYPSGNPVRLFPGDLGGHRTVSLTSDGRTILAESYSHNTEIWHAGPDGFDLPRPITVERHHFFRLIRWVPDGRIVFGSSTGGNRDIWLTDLEGRNFHQVTANAGQNEMPYAASDNMHMVFVSNRAGKGVFNIWRSKLDGSDPVQLTYGSGEQFPVVSSDMKWVVYEDNPMSTQPERSSIWRVPFEGDGDAVQITPVPTQQADVSPDGKLVACEYKPNADSKWKIGIFSIDGGPPIKVFDLPEVSPLRWMPDGKAVSYIKTDNGVANLWAQPIDGGPPYQVTRFTADGIPSYCDWSSKFGLICSRGRVVRDAVLITGFR